MTTKAQQKAFEKAAFQDRVRRGLKAAHDVADVTARAHLATAELGLLDCLHNHATVGVDRPTYRLREALKTLGELDRYGVNWYVSRDWGHIADTRSVIYEHVGGAAAAHLQQEFPEDGKFYNYVGASLKDYEGSVG